MAFVWNKDTVSMIGEPYNANKPTYRYCLIGNKNAKKPLIVIGLNPSTADENNYDPTMRRVISFIDSNGFDGFVMFNLYPVRTLHPEDLIKIGLKEDIHKGNLKEINSYIETLIKHIKTNPTILLAFGVHITTIPILTRYFEDIIRNIAEKCKPYKPEWYRLQSVHPQHPLRFPKDSFLESFDVNEYIKKLEEL